MSFYDLVLTPAAATTPVSQKWREEEVWLSLHSANGNEHSSHQQYYFLTLQVKCQGHTRTLKKCYKTFKVRGDQKVFPQQWFICTLDLLFSSSPRTVTMGNALPLQGHLHMMLWSPGIQHQREAAFCLLPTQQSGKNASCTILALHTHQQA